MSVTAPGESQRIIAAKIVSEFTMVPLAHTTEPPPRSCAIIVRIENYAASRPTELASAVKPPPKVGIPALDAIASDREVSLHRNSPPTPEPKVPKYEAFSVVDGVAQPVTSGGNPAADETIDSFGTTVRIRGTSNG